MKISFNDLKHCLLSHLIISKSNAKNSLQKNLIPNFGSKFFFNMVGYNIRSSSPFELSSPICKSLLMSYIVFDFVLESNIKKKQIDKPPLLTLHEKLPLTCIFPI